MNINKAKLVWMLIVLCIPVAHVSGAYAANWTVTPSVSIRETYTDNITLATSGQEQSELITEVNPSITISGEGKRLRLNFAYSMQNLIHADDSSRDRTNHQLSADGNAELIERLFFIDATASMSQQLISNTGRVGLDNLSDTGNRTDVAAYSISPYLTHRFGGYVDTELRYTYSGTAVDTGASDSDSHRVDLSLASGKRFTKFRWNLNYQNQQQGRDTATDVENESASGSIRYGIHRKLDLMLQGGYEQNDFNNSIDANNGTYWSGGFDWHPSRKFSFQALTGDNFTSATLNLAPQERTTLQIGWQDSEIGVNTGSSWNMDLTHRTRRSTWTASYSENTTTTQQLLSELENFVVFDPTQGGFGDFIRDPDTGEIIIFGREVFSLTDDIFISKRLQGAVSMTTGKSSLGFSLFREEREFQIAGNSQTSTGGNASWGWDVAPRTHSNISAGWQRTEFSSLAREDESWNLSVGLTRTLSRNVTGSVDFRHLENESNSAANSYEENRASARLNISF